MKEWDKDQATLYYFLVVGRFAWLSSCFSTVRLRCFTLGSFCPDSRLFEFIDPECIAKRLSGFSRQESCVAVDEERSNTPDNCIKSQRWSGYQQSPLKRSGLLENLALDQAALPNLEDMKIKDDADYIRLARMIRDSERVQTVISSAFEPFVFIT